MGMSQEFFDPELFADFIAEAKEHLETIEPNLLELEKLRTTWPCSTIFSGPCTLSRELPAFWA